MNLPETKDITQQDNQSIKEIETTPKAILIYEDNHGNRIGSQVIEESRYNVLKESNPNIVLTNIVTDEDYSFSDETLEDYLSNVICNSITEEEYDFLMRVGLRFIGTTFLEEVENEVSTGGAIDEDDYEDDYDDEENEED